MKCALLLTLIPLLLVCGCGGQASAPEATIPVSKALPIPVIFVGASTVELWQNSVDFPSRHWIDKGISGQTCADVLARFQTDVIDARPGTVHIFCGTNDVWWNKADLATTTANLDEMARKAKAARIAVVLGTLQPIRPGLQQWFPEDMQPRLDAVNAWITSYAAQQHIRLADYAEAMKDSDGYMKTGLTYDGVHPNADGYALMTGIFVRATASDIDVRAGKHSAPTQTLLGINPTPTSCP